MSFSSADTSALSSIGANAGIPDLNTADIPANIRNGNAAGAAGVQRGPCVRAGTRQRADHPDGQHDGLHLDGSVRRLKWKHHWIGDSSGLLGGSSASGYSSLIPQALTSSIMAGGGIGLADEFAQELDPALADPTSTAAGGTAAAAPTVTPTTATSTTATSTTATRK